MIKQFKLHQLFCVMTAMGVVAVTNTAQASGFKLWEQDAASIGNYHAGVAATADDASTAYYNPAGLVRIQNQQLIAGLDPVLTDFKFRGTVANNLILAPAGPQSVVAQGGNTSIVPFLHYAAPLDEKWVFGFSVTSPFGLKTSYGNQTFARYAATYTSLQVIDVSPSLAFAINNKWSLGAGFDYQHADAQFNLIAGAGTPATNTSSDNSGKSNAYGYHLGILFQPTEQTRIGLAYQSQMVHHLRGDSNFSGLLANYPNGLLTGTPGFQGSSQLKADVTLPPTTMLSLFHSFNTTWDVLGTVSYTQWNVFKKLVLQNVAGVNTSLALSNSIVVIVPENYRNTWNASLGANYHVNEQVLLRTGLGFDETPTNNSDRNLQLPDSDRIALAFGGHFQMNKSIGFDAGWTHYFLMNTRINNVVQAVGAQVSTTNGSVHSSADVFGAQIKWDIA